jgi:hypothetical protein
MKVDQVFKIRSYFVCLFTTPTTIFNKIFIPVVQQNLLSFMNFKQSFHFDWLVSFPVLEIHPSHIAQLAMVINKIQRSIQDHHPPSIGAFVARLSLVIFEATRESY